MSNRFLKSQLLSIPLIAMLSTSIEASAPDNTAEEIFGTLIEGNSTDTVPLAVYIDRDDLDDFINSDTNALSKNKYLCECIRTVICNLYNIRKTYINDSENGIKTNLGDLTYDAIQKSGVLAPSVLKGQSTLLQLDTKIKLDSILDDFARYMALSFEQLVSRTSNSYITRFMQVLISLSHGLTDITTNKFRTPTEAKGYLTEFIYTANKALEELQSVSTLKERPAMLMLSLMLNGIKQSKDGGQVMDTLPMKVSNEGDDLKATGMKDDENIINNLSAAIEALKTGAQEALNSIPTNQLAQTLLVSTDLSKEMLAEDVYRLAQQEFDIEVNDIKVVKRAIKTAVEAKKYTDGTTSDIISEILDSAKLDDELGNKINKSDIDNLLFNKEQEMISAINALNNDGKKISFKKYYNRVSDELQKYTIKRKYQDRLIKNIIYELDRKITINDILYETPADKDEREQDEQITINLALTQGYDEIMYTKDDLDRCPELNAIYNTGAKEYEEFDIISKSDIFAGQHLQQSTMKQKIDRYNELKEEAKWIVLYEHYKSLVTNASDDYAQQAYFKNMSRGDQDIYKEHIEDKITDDNKLAFLYELEDTAKNEGNTPGDKIKRKNMIDYICDTLLAKETNRKAVIDKIGGNKQVSEEEKDKANEILLQIEAIAAAYAKGTDEYNNANEREKQRIIEAYRPNKGVVLDAIESEGKEALKKIKIKGRTIELRAPRKSQLENYNLPEYKVANDKIYIILKREAINDEDIEGDKIKVSELHKYIITDLYSEEEISDELMKDLSESVVYNYYTSRTVNPMIHNRYRLVKNDQEGEDNNNENNDNQRDNNNNNENDENGNNTNLHEEPGQDGHDEHEKGRQNTRPDKPSTTGNPKPGEGARTPHDLRQAQFSSHKPNQRPNQSSRRDDTERADIKAWSTIPTILTDMKTKYNVQNNEHDKELVDTLIEILLIKGSDIIKQQSEGTFNIETLTKKLESIIAKKTLEYNKTPIDMKELTIKDYMIGNTLPTDTIRPGIIIDRTGGKLIVSPAGIHTIEVPLQLAPNNEIEILMLSKDLAYVKRIKEKKYKEIQHEEEKERVKETDENKDVHELKAIKAYAAINKLVYKKASLDKLLYLIKDEIDYKNMTKENDESAVASPTNIKVATYDGKILIDADGAAITEQDVINAKQTIEAKAQGQGIDALEAGLLTQLKTIDIVKENQGGSKPNNPFKFELHERDSEIIAELKKLPTKDTNALTQYINGLSNAMILHLTKQEVDAIFTAASQCGIPVGKDATELTIGTKKICALTLAEDYIKTGDFNDDTIKINENGKLMTSRELKTKTTTIKSIYNTWLNELTSKPKLGQQAPKIIKDKITALKRIKETGYLDECMDTILPKVHDLDIRRVIDKLKVGDVELWSVLSLSEELLKDIHEPNAIVEIEIEDNTPIKPGETRIIETEYGYIKYNNITEQQKADAIVKKIATTENENDDNKYYTELSNICKMVNNASFGTQNMTDMVTRIRANMFVNNFKLTDDMIRDKTIVIEGINLGPVPQDKPKKVGDEMVTKDNRLKKAEQKDIGPAEAIELTVANYDIGLGCIRELRKDGKINIEDGDKLGYQDNTDDHTNNSIKITYDNNPVLIYRSSNIAHTHNDIERDVKAIITKIRKDIKKYKNPPASGYSETDLKKYKRGITQGGQQLYD